MIPNELLEYIRTSREAGLNDAEIRNSLLKGGWAKEQVDAALRPAGKGGRTKEAVSYILLAVLAVALANGVFFIYDRFAGGPAPTPSNFELLARMSDAAGVRPDTTFTLKSSVDLSEDAIEDSLSVEPKVGLDITRTSAGVYEIKPEEHLPENKVFTVRIEEGPVAERTFSWAYQVKAPFRVASTLPRDKSQSVPTDSGVEVTFNREGLISPQDHFEIQPAVPGRFEVHRNILVFVPTNNLAPETVYTVTIKNGLKMEGSDDVLADAKVFRFETADRPYRGPTPHFRFTKTFWEFKPGVEPAFEVSFYALPEPNFPAKAYRFDSAKEFTDAYQSAVMRDNGWSRFNRYKPYQAPDSKRIFEGDLTIETQQNVHFVRIPRELPEGFYMLNLTVAGRQRQIWFQVTPLTSYSAVSGTQSLIWLRRLDGGQPVAGGDVMFDGKSLGRTNADGVVQFGTPGALTSEMENGYYEYWSEPRYLYTVKAQDKELVIPVESRYGGYSTVSPPDEWWDYLSLDRTIYQPTDKLRFWGIVQRRNGSDARGEVVTMQLTEPFWYGTSPEDVTVYASTNATVGDFYTLTGELDFAGLRPGLYQLSVKRGDRIIVSQNVSVEAYIKPAYRLVVEPDRNAVFADQTVNFKVRAEFFDGTPVSNLAVKYDGYFEKQVQGTVRLNAQGEGSFSVKTVYDPSSYSRYWPHYAYVTVSPTVSEEGEIAQSSSVLVFGPEMDLSATQSRNGDRARFDLKLRQVVLDKIQKGQPFWVSENYLGDPVPNYPVTAQVTEITYQAVQTGTGYDIINKTTYPIYRYDRNERVIRTENFTTDGRGEASFEQATEKGKSYRVSFTARDRSGREVREDRYVYGGDTSPFSYYGLGVINLKNQDEGKTKYRLGERITFQTQDGSGQPVRSGSKTFMYYRVTGGIDSYQVADGPDFEDHFREPYLPNVNFVAVWFDGTKFYDSWPVNISFDSEDRRLTIGLKRNKDRYRPGEEVELSLQVTDPSGKPKEAEVNVSALDEAAFSLNPEEKDVLNDLYRDNPPSLVTRSSHFSPLESGVGAEGGGCFLPGTEILTADGPKRIEDIRVGDTILTRASDGSDEMTAAKVRRTTTHLVDRYLVINERVRVTGNHRMFVNGRWLAADLIRAGDTLLDAAGQPVTVTSVRQVRDWRWVHNFEVDGVHTYFADGFYVHNEEKGGGEARGEFKDSAIYTSVRTGTDGRANVKFKLPDNVTSWRLTLQAVSKDLFAGKTLDFVPVGLPFFVETAMNRTYLANDSLVLRARVFGTANIPEPVNYKIESETLPFRSLQKNGSKAEEFDLGPLTAGLHKIKVSASAGGLSDAIIREVTVLPGYFTKSASQYYDVSPQLSGVRGNAGGPTELLFASRERGRLFSPLLSFLWERGARADQVTSRYLADVLLKRFFDPERKVEPVELTAYQYHDGGITLLPYSDSDLALSAKFADVMRAEETDVSRDALKGYFMLALNDRETLDLPRTVAALYGLAALGEPVLVSLENIKNDPNLTLTDKAYIALGLDALGAKESARDYYLENFKPKLFVKEPHAYITALGSKDDNIVLTAMLARLTGSLEEPESELLAAYAFDTRPAETLINFELLGYIKETLPNLKGGDVSFTWRTNRRNGTETLRFDENFRLVLLPDELASLRFENVDGRIGLVSFFEEPSLPEQLTKDADVGLRRAYSVGGRQTTEFKDGDLVKVELTSSYGPRALPGLYQITDYLPSGLRPVTRFNIFPLQSGECILYPSLVQDQRVTFLDWNPKYPRCPTVFYYARVVTKGTYKAEPALIQSVRNLRSLNVSAPASVIIR